MLKLKFIIFFFPLFFLFSCKEENAVKPDTQINVINEKNYVLDSRFKVGDARRYGIYPDSLNNTKHPNTGKYKIQTLLDFAEESQTTINFPPGDYGINIFIDSRENINFRFNNSEFRLIHITNANGKDSKNISLKGTLVAYNRFVTFNSSHIKVDTLILKSNPIKSLKKVRNQGCRIYQATKFLEIDYLEIDDLGSGGKEYKTSQAAITIQGQRNNPNNVTIHNMLIKSSDRHGAYITGDNHYFGNILIEKYGQGDTDGMINMQDANKADSHILSGLWINRCNNSVFNKVEIHTINSKKGYPLKLDEGKLSEPTFINKLVLDVPYKDELVIDDNITNILVKKIELAND